jgi:prepilin-type N-terminal cleavage/methylation domain-containing protein
VTRSDRPGFTLIELLVALLVGAMIVLGARLMLEGVADDAHRVTSVAQRADNEANAERLLRSTVAAIDVSGSGVQAFDGDARAARFSSWCARPAGWQERCAVTLTITGDSGATALMLTLGGGAPLEIRAGSRHGELLYLADVRDGGHWVSSWNTGLTAPIAIGAVIDADTLVLAIGERG